MRHDHLPQRPPKRPRLDAPSTPSGYHQPASLSNSNPIDLGAGPSRTIRPQPPRFSNRSQLQRSNSWHHSNNARSSHQHRQNPAPPPPPPPPPATATVSQQNVSAQNLPLPPMNLSFPSMSLPPVTFNPRQFPSQPQYTTIDPALRNLPRPFPSPVLNATPPCPTTDVTNSSIRPITTPPAAPSRNQGQSSNRYRETSTVQTQGNKKETTSTTTANGHHHSPSLRSIGPVARAIELIPEDSPIISALARVLAPMSATMSPAAQRQLILNFTGFSLSDNPNFRSLLELHKNELEVLAWVFVVSRNGRKDEVARRICNSLRAPLKHRAPSNRRPIIPVRSVTRSTTTLPSTINAADHIRLLGSRATNSPRARGSMPSLVPPPAPGPSPRADNILNDLERHLQPNPGPRLSSSSLLPQLNGTTGQARTSPAQNRNKQARDLCEEMLKGYAFKVAENPFNDPMNAPLGAKNFVVFSAVQLSRGNSDPVLLFPTPPPIDPAVRPEVHGGQVQIHLRCLRVEVEKAKTEWKQSWPFPASCRVNGHIVQLNQAQRYTNGKLAGLDTATDITAYLRKYKSAMSESNRVTLRRQSSTATPASGQFVMFAQEILVYSKETMIKKVHDSSEKYWQEYRRNLERKGQISPSTSRFEMARHGVVLFLSDPDGVTVSSMKVSLRCPLALTRIETPVKGKRCQHVQCFDLKNFLEYTRRSSKFECPVCNKNTAHPSMLVISPYIEHALEEHTDCDEVEIFQDGSMVAVERKQTGVASDDEDEDGPKPMPNGHAQGNAKPAAEVVDLTLDSDDDDEVPAISTERTPSNAQISVANLLQGNNRNDTFDTNSHVLPQFPTYVASQTLDNPHQIRDDNANLDQDIDFTFNSGFVPWADTGQTTNEINASAIHLATAPSNNNNSTWPEPIDVIAIDSD